MKNQFLIWLSEVFYKKSLTWKVKTTEKEVFITFDDGPTESYTEKILEILDCYNVRATFFCLAKNVEKFPELFERIKHSGHSIGNHGYEHLNGWKISREKFLENVFKADKIISSKIFRPPYGGITPCQAKGISKHFKVIMWRTMSRDYSRRMTAEKCLKRLKRNITPGDIIVFHDSESASETTIKVLPEFLKYINEKGYKTSVINEV
ncbi:MAG: polysaccharide deacetylase family protein [Bacteroidetes bacterium]|nr:polysaccharide deacetylase family protein [Bacteroidota bacterium]